MNDQQITQEINALNLKLEETNSAVNNISKSLDNFSDTFQQLVSQLLTPDNFVDKYSPALIGLFGVLLGAFIAYCFNRKMYKEQLIGRFAIQRKNLIFSKLYKEFVNIKKSLNSIPEGCFYFRFNISTIHHYNEKYFHFDGKNYDAADFILWNEMKNDIRKTQIPDRIKKEISNLEKAIIKYDNSLEKFIKKCEEKEKQENEKMIEIYQRKELNKNSVFGLKYNKIYFQDYSIKKVVESNIQEYGFQKNIELQDEIENVVKRVVDIGLLNMVEKDFKNMKIALDKTHNILYETIQEIVNKYEYGKLL